MPAPDPFVKPGWRTLKVHRRTWIALMRIREDRSYATIDMVMRQLIERSYPGQYDLD